MFTEIGASLRACAGDVMRQEQRLFKALNEITAHAQRGDNLELYDSNGQLRLELSLTTFITDTTTQAS